MQRPLLGSLAACLLLLNLTHLATAQQPLQLEKGNRVTILGGGLPDTMQHFGWLETLIQARFPQHELVIRNLAFTGDAVNTWHRSKNFGSLDEWLHAEGKPIGGFNENRFATVQTKPDVIIAFYGFNESFAGAAGVSAFEAELDKWTKARLANKYNGKSAPQIVLCTPIAHEDLGSPNLPDGKARNEDIKLYAEAVLKVAKANGVIGVDLFNPTLKGYAADKQHWTTNGVHPNEHGDRQIAGIFDQALFGKALGKSDKDLAKLNAAVLDKSFYWFHRYRTTDGFSTYGDRAFLKFNENAPPKSSSYKAKEGGKGGPLPTNYEVMQRELQALDTMTANRDRAVWAAAQGKVAKVDDSNRPEPINARTNTPGLGEDGKHVFLSGQDAIGKMKIAAKYKVSLFASEKEFPELVNPVQMAFDTKGRLWVIAWESYPHWNPNRPMADKLLILEDTNGDGKADKCKTFAGDLQSPTGFEFWNGGVIVATPPNLWHLKDSDGDDKVDQRTLLLGGFDSADTHHAINSFFLDQGGGLHFGEGTFHQTQVESPYGVLRNVNASSYRFEPRTFKFERHAAYGFANPHGRVFDAWGQDIIHDGTGADPYWGTLISGYMPAGQNHGGAPKVYKKRTRPCPGSELVSSRHFPDDVQGNLLVGNVIGFQGILQYKLADNGAGITGTEVEPLLSSEDPNFRPVDFEFGPDGAFYFTDWQNPLIGHMQHNLRDTSRDHLHGRVYRVTYEGRPLLKPAKVAGQPVPALLALLKEPEDRVRYLARIELSGRTAEEVIPVAKKWIASLDKSDKNYELHRLEGLWLHQSFNVVDEALLKDVLRSPDFRARAAATRVLCHWRDRVSSVYDLLKTQVNDEHPRVRLEAVRACSWVNTAKAGEVALESLNHPQDEYLKYMMAETMKVLQKAK